MERLDGRNASQPALQNAADQATREQLLAAFRARDASGSGMLECREVESFVGRLLAKLFLVSQGREDAVAISYADFVDWLLQGPGSPAESSSVPPPSVPSPRVPVAGSAGVGGDEAWYGQTRRALHFANLCSFSQIGWVRVSFLRASRRQGSLKQGRPLPRRQDLPGGALVAGPAPPGVNCWVVSHPWLAKQHADVTGEQLLEVLARLDDMGAGDEDVVFYDYLSMFQKSVSGEDDRSADQRLLFKRALRSINELYSSPFCKVVIVTTIPASAREGPRDVSLEELGVQCARVDPNPIPYIQRGWCYFELFVTLLFRRHAQLTDAECIGEVEELMSELLDAASLAHEPDRPLLKQRLQSCVMSTEAHCQAMDREACSLIQDGTFSFVRIGYIRRLLREGGFIPRRQDVPPAEVLGDWLQRRLHVVIYTHLEGDVGGWSVFDPDRVILRDLVKKLDVIGASDADGVMLHHMSYPQPPFVTDEERTMQQKALGSMHLFCMSRRFQCLICKEAFRKRGIQIHERGYPLMQMLASAFTGSLMYDDQETVDIIVEHVFLVGMRRRTFTNGTEDMDLVGGLFKALLYQRAGMSELLESTQ